MAKYTLETDVLYQYSVGYRLKVPTAYAENIDNIVTQFYSKSYPNGVFVNSYESDESGAYYCPVPYSLTENADTLIVYAYLLESSEEDEDGNIVNEGRAITESKTVIAVHERPEPPDTVVDPTQTITYATISELIASMRESLEAEELRVEAEASRVSAEELRADAEELRVLAEAVRSVNESDREEAEESREDAEALRVEAETSRETAEASRQEAELEREATENTRIVAEAEREEKWRNATATAHVSTTPTVTVDVQDSGVAFSFGLQKGDKGDTGNDGYTPVKNVDYFDGYTPQKNVDYFDGEKGDKGDTGDAGNGVASVTLISGSHSAGTVDTYRMTFTDGTYVDFGIYNGANGEGAGDMLWAEWDNRFNPEGKTGQILVESEIPTIPTKLSDLTADSTHRTVTDTEKSTWNAKSNFSGSYTDLSNKPTIPTKLSDLTADATHRVVTDAEKTTWNAKSDFSGSYNDLTDKPTGLGGFTLKVWS